MDIHQYTLGPLSTKSYLLEKNKKALIIDPVDSADFLLEEVSRRNLDLVALVATHGHFDHIMAAGEMQLAYRDIRSLPLYIHPDDHFLVKRLADSARYFLGYEPDVIKPMSFVDLNAGEMSISEFSFMVMLSPGHTPGGISLVFEKDHLLFPGDTLFQGSVGRSDFSYSDRVALKNSVERLLQLPEETVVYPGHGPCTTIGAERKASFFV